MGKLLQGLGLTPPAAAAPPPLPAHAPAPAAGPGQQLAFPSPLEFVRQTYSEDTQPQQQADTQVTSTDWLFSSTPTMLTLSVQCRM